jgi:hypothetical protein
MSDLTPDFEAERTVADTDQGPITRQAFHDLIWPEPMPKIATRFRGVVELIGACLYGAERTQARARLLGQVCGRQGARAAALAGTRVPGPTPERKADPTTDRHRLVIGAKKLFEARRGSWTVGYLKPTKRLLVGLTVIKSALDQALALANRLFVALENEGHPGSFAAPGEQLGRAEIDVREAPSKAPPAHDNL